MITAAAAAVFYLVLDMSGTSVIPEPYQTKAECMEAGTQISKDHKNKEYGSPLMWFRFACVQAPR